MKREMRTRNIVLLIGLLFFAISCNQLTRKQAETANNEIVIEQNIDTQQSECDVQTEGYIPVYCPTDESTYCSLAENDSEITQFPLNEFYSIRIREISQSEFTTRRRETRHLQHRPSYQVIRDSAEVRTLLGDRVREVGERLVLEYGFERIDGSWDHGFWYNGISITYNNGVTKVYNILWNWNQTSYYPELGILIVSDFWGDGFLVTYLNNSERDRRRIGHPNLHNLSPDRQWRLNGSYTGFGEFLFLEKWNPTRRRFEFAGFDNIPDLDWVSDGFWVGSSTLLLWSTRGRFEAEIVVNERK